MEQLFQGNVPLRHLRKVCRVSVSKKKLTNIFLTIFIPIFLINFLHYYRESKIDQPSDEDKEIDLPPNYEENSDLESTIQKLRQLLSERSHESVSSESNANNSNRNGSEEKSTIFNIKVDIGKQHALKKYD